MTDPLLKYFEAGQAPETDLAFRLAVMERMARRRLYIETAKNAGLALLFCLSIALAWPGLSAAFSEARQPLMPTITILAMTGILAFGGQWISRHPGYVRRLLRAPMPRLGR